MRQFSLKHGTLVPHPDADDKSQPARTIYPEPMRMAEPNWPHRNWTGESVQQREGDMTDDELRAAREWFAHVEAGRIG